MSMIGNFLLVGDDDLARLVSSPEGIEAFLDEHVHEARSPVGHVDVDKAWHVLHFLLTGTAWEGAAPLNFIVAGGEVIGEVDVGYGPARALRHAAVVELDRALQGLDAAALASRYDGKKMDALELYPGGSGSWATVDPEDPEQFGYFAGAYEDLKNLVHQGATQERGLLIWLS